MVLSDKNIKHVHCMGIGGIGVSAIAEILLRQGYQVSGSDIAENKNVTRLEKLGAEIVLGHQKTNIQNADLAVYSSAIAKDNPEYMAAKNAGIPLLQRGQILAELMRPYCGIAVAGAHGKTTTTGMIAYTLLAGGIDPSFAVGGILNDIDSPVHLGKGRYFVAEADESDASLLFMDPNIVVVTNIDADHLETYGGNFNRLKQTFVEFLAKLPVNGTAILCIDDPNVRELISALHCKVITYGFDSDADFSAHDFFQEGLQSHFKVKRPDRSSSLTIALNMPGKHNVLNALATIAVAHCAQLSDDSLLKSLASFPGVGRRFQCHGEMLVNDGRAVVIEDYGHHPNEVKATLIAAHQVYPERRIVLVFQPHRYTRTRDLMNDFSQALSEADVLVLLEIYSAGEQPISGIDGAALCRMIEKISNNKPIFVSDLNSLPDVLQKTLRNDDIVILQGAGSVGTMAVTLAQL